MCKRISFGLLQMLTDGLERCGLLWCFYQTLILTAPIHCRDTDAVTHFYKSDEEINSSTSRMARGQVHAQHMVIFGGTIPLKRPGIDYNVLMCSLVSGRRYNHSLRLLYFKMFSSAACLVALSTLYFPAYLVFNLASALHSCVNLHRHLKGDRWCLLHGILLTVCPRTLMKDTSMNTFKRVFSLISSAFTRQWRVSNHLVLQQISST